MSCRSVKTNPRYNACSYKDAPERRKRNLFNAYVDYSVSHETIICNTRVAVFEVLIAMLVGIRSYRV